MKIYFPIVLALFIMVILLTGGCGDTSSTTSASSGVIEGQLVADTGVQFAKIGAFSVPKDAGRTPSPVYPVSGTTVELLQDGVVIAATITDEYGRFQFTGLAPGDYEVRTTANDGSIAHYHVFVEANQIVTVYGRAISGTCYWEQEYGPQWDDMPFGPHWGGGFSGAAPGPGYWHNGQTWCEPQSSGPHGPHHQ